MSKFVITTALALVLAGGAYAQGHHGGGGGGGMGGGGGRGGGMAAHGPSMGGGGGGMAAHGPRMGGGPGPSFTGPRGPGGPHVSGNTFNRGPTMNNRANGENFNRRQFTQGGSRQLYNRYEGNRVEGNRVEGRPDRRGVVSGNFFEHGRHFRFRRFFNGEWVFLNAWDDCAAWAWVNVAPGVWAWRPVDVCIG
jgi:hypothetical protein